MRCHCRRRRRRPAAKTLLSSVAITVPVSSSSHDTVALIKHYCHAAVSLSPPLQPCQLFHRNRHARMCTHTLVCVKVTGKFLYVAQYPVLKTLLSDKPVQSNTISTYLRSIQPYCEDYWYTDIYRCKVSIHTIE